MEKCEQVSRESSLFRDAGYLQGSINKVWERSALFQLEVKRRRLHHDWHDNLSDRSICVLVPLGARVYSDCISKQGAAPTSTRIEIREFLWCAVRSACLDTARRRLHARSDVAVVAKICHATQFTVERDHSPPTPSV